MKKILLIVLTCFFSFQNFAQDPDPALYQTWYLTSMYVDKGPATFILDIDPPISPFLIIDESLGFTGQVCNEYGGYFSYNSSDSLILEDFGPCLCGTCIDPAQSHIVLENNYFDYFYFEEPVYYELDTQNPVENFLALYFSPGFALYYQNFPLLSITENELQDIGISPNPVSDQLYISSENVVIETITIYSLNGKKVAYETTKTNSIDVSTLSKGMYFIEVSSESGKSIKKFIKK